MRPIDANSAKSSILVVADCMTADCDWLNGYKTGLLAATEAIDEIPTIEAEPVKWIPVTERLPEDGELVLAWSESLRDLGMGVLDEFESTQVTHWMPLPEPPEMDGEKE